MGHSVHTVAEVQVMQLVSEGEQGLHICDESKYEPPRHDWHTPEFEQVKQFGVTIEHFVHCFPVL